MIVTANRLADHQIHGGDLDLKRKLAAVYIDVKPDVAFITH